jgi:UDP-N-acetyl-2-amino-2-deoxyglucuronate dehydrogenase
MNRKIKFSIVGCGRISYRHIEAIRDNPLAELIAVCDLNLEKACLARGDSSAAVYQNYHEMLTKEQIDVVCLMTPSGMHGEHAADIIEKHQKHLVIEKPLTLRVEDGEKVLKIAHKHGVKLFIVHQNRFNKAVTMIRKVIESGDLGRIVLATLRLRWSRGQAYYDRDPWRGTYALDGGALTNQAVHHIDLLRWLVGDVERLSAIGATQLVKVEVEDSACGWLAFKNGAIGTIEATTAVRPLDHDLEASISILGEKGVVIAEGAAVNKLTTCSVANVELKNFSEEVPNVYGFGHNVIINNVIDALLHGAPPLVAAEDALESIRLLNAIYRSIELGGKEVRMIECPISERLGVFTRETEKIAEMYRTEKAMGG